MFTDLLRFAYFTGIHQVRLLVFDNYQRCPVLKSTLLSLFEIVNSKAVHTIGSDVVLEKEVIFHDYDFTGFVFYALC